MRLDPTYVSGGYCPLLLFHKRFIHETEHFDWWKHRQGYSYSLAIHDNTLCKCCMYSVARKRSCEAAMQLFLLIPFLMLVCQTSFFQSSLCLVWKGRLMKNLISREAPKVIFTTSAVGELLMANVIYYLGQSLLDWS